MRKKPTRGGRRVGAGRKPSLAATVRLNLFVKPSIAAIIRDRGLSAYITRLVEADF